MTVSISRRSGRGVGGCPSGRWCPPDRRPGQGTKKNGRLFPHPHVWKPNNQPNQCNPPTANRKIPTVDPACPEPGADSTGWPPLGLPLLADIPSGLRRVGSRPPFPSGFRRDGTRKEKVPWRSHTSFRDRWVWRPPLPAPRENGPLKPPLLAFGHPCPPSKFPPTPPLSPPPGVSPPTMAESNFRPPYINDPDPGTRNPLSSHGKVILFRPKKP